MLLFPFAKTNSEKRKISCFKDFKFKFNFIIRYVVIYTIYICIVKQNMIIGRPKQFYTVFVQIYISISLLPF